MKDLTNRLEIANKIIDLAKQLKEDTMSNAKPVQASPPSGAKAKRKRRIQELVNKRLAKVDH